MRFSGAFRARVEESWIEMRENLGRSVLQTLGIMVGVAAVLGGFSISDSQRRRVDEMMVKRGGMDKLVVQPAANVNDGASRSALQTANLGLRNEDTVDGAEAGERVVAAVSEQRNTFVRVRSPYADQERRVTGAGGDFLDLEGYELDQGRLFSSAELTGAGAAAVLGAAAVQTFFPTGDALGQTLRVGDVIVVVVGTLREKVFRFRSRERNIMAWQNEIVAVPATLVSRKMQGDAYRRVDRIIFKVPQLDLIEKFAIDLGALLKANHRQQEDYRLDDIATRMRKRQSQGAIYNMIFVLSGILSLVGGGMVNVNIQLASLKERVREVGVKMAVGASGVEVFKQFMTEALLLSILGGVSGLVLGVGFSWAITAWIEIPLRMDFMSFVYAYLMAASFGFVFALYPAWKAARLSPMEALRYE